MKVFAEAKTMTTAAAIEHDSFSSRIFKIKKHLIHIIRKNFESWSGRTVQNDADRSRHRWLMQPPAERPKGVRLSPPALSSSIIDLIGNTPLVELKRINPNPKVKLCAKLEMFNPGGSVKDRIAKAMIEAAERNGQLTKDKIILEPTSGNTGIGLALVAAAKGYKVMLTMSKSVSLERRRILHALGAKIVFTPASKGTDGAIEKAYEMARSRRYFMPDQFNNPENVLAHYKTTGPEIWRQTKGRVTHFVAGMGTTGTLMGVGRFLKEKGDVKIIGVEPFLGHKIQGLKNMKEAYKPGIYDKTLLDEKVNVRDEDAFETIRLLAKKEGILAGMSSGAALYVALEKVKTLDRGVVVVLLPDGGERYLSTNLFKEVRMK